MVTKQTLPLIRFFSSVGEPDDFLLHSILYSEKNCLDDCLIRYCDHEKYGGDLSFILIEIYVEGKQWEPMGISTLKGLPLRYISYNKKEKTATVAAFLKRREFHLKKSTERREVIAEKVLNCVNLVKDKLKDKNLNFNFEVLSQDLNNAICLFLEKKQ